MKPHRKAAIGALLLGATLTGGALGASMFSGIAERADQRQHLVELGPGHRAGYARRSDRIRQRAGTPPTASPRSVLTGDTATKVSAAAQAAVPDGTIQPWRTTPKVRPTKRTWSRPTAAKSP